MYVKLIFFAIILLFAVHFSYAQKLPDIQDKSIYAPSNVKADGKDLEWKDTFQALNKRTNLYYTLANDQENLYLIIKSSDAGNNNKIMSGGIDFTINTDGKKKENEGLTITYPLVKSSRGSMRTGSTSGRRSEGSARTEASEKKRDSAMLILRKEQLSQVKEIKLYGFRAIPDTLISIYNEYRLKAFASFDAKGVFFYELAIPLKLLGLAPATPNEFAYNIKINGLKVSSFGGGKSSSGSGSERQGGRTGGGSYGGGSYGGGSRSGGFSDMQSLFNPTDFWGTYTLTQQ